ncbi:MAG: hypothetical protein AAGA85_05005 [Bacteroidota bacterium]
MKIGLDEIWTFVKVMDDRGINGLTFIAGNVKVEGLTRSTLDAILSDEDYDQELLPSLFTFREILWQPQVYRERLMALPALKILKGFCDEVAVRYADDSSTPSPLYLQLLNGISTAAEASSHDLEQGEQGVVQVIRNLRIATFPIIKFFIHHPRNRPDHRRDAVNRLNYAVKIMLTEFHGLYSQLKDPYWIVGSGLDHTGTTKKSDSPAHGD